jgi:hypothetical protein
MARDGPCRCEISESAGFLAKKISIRETLFYAAHPFMGGLLFDCMDFEVVNRSWDF